MPRGPGRYVRLQVKRLSATATRKLILWFFDEPSNDPYVSLNFDVDLAPVRAFLDAFEREHGERIGVQHVLTKARSSSCPRST